MRRHRRTWIAVILVVLVCLAGTPRGREVAKKFGVEEYIPTADVKLEDVKDMANDVLWAVKTGNFDLAVSRIEYQFCYWADSITWGPQPTQEEAFLQQMEQAQHIFEANVRYLQAQAERLAEEVQEEAPQEEAPEEEKPMLVDLNAE